MEFFKVFFVTVALCFAFWIAIVVGQVGKATQMSQWISDAYQKKLQIAEKIKERKIVVVAGSNALFGIDSSMLSNAFHTPVVNAAVNAGIELPCTLFMAKRFIGEGDTVLMPLEYPMYSYNGEAGVQMIDFIFSRAFDCFWELTWKEQFYIVWHASLKRVWEGYGKYMEKPVTNGVYGAHHIDKYGDQTHTDLQNRSDEMYKEVLQHIEEPEVYGSKFNKDALGWMYLEKFVSWCKQRNVKVIFMPSTIMRSDSYKNNTKEKWFYRHIAEEVRNRGWIYIGDPYDYMYDKSMYFNTNFHLTDEGRKVRSRQMIKDLSGFNMGQGL